MMKSFWLKLESKVTDAAKSTHLSIRDAIFLASGLVCIVLFIVFACLAQSQFGLAHSDCVSYGAIYTKTDEASAALREGYLASIHDAHVSFIILTALAFVCACLAIFFVVFTFAKLNKTRKSRRLSLVFVSLAVAFVVAFFYAFAFVRVLSGYYSQLGTLIQSADAKANAGLLSFYNAQRGIINQVYTAYSFFTYLASLLAIVAVGLGLKLVDSAKEKEEQADNLHVFVEGEDGDALEMSSES